MLEAGSAVDDNATTDFPIASIISFQATSGMNPGKYTLPGAFKAVYAKHPELAAMDKAAHVAKVTKAMGYYAA